MVHEVPAIISCHDLRIAIVVARFNEVVTERLLQGALDLLRQRGVQDDAITVAWVPGAFELPLACQWLAKSGRHDAVLALGAVVRGGTDHYGYVCHAVTDGVLRVTLATGVPIAFGVLTCSEMAQALARAGGDAGNKGADAAAAAIAMAQLRRALPS
ncbi:MAG: 6,7-dimethyl-8-ribityllumazine synthase [Planctomycetota bacterium]|jgi:6,7-dimethyl-8-ribityllumazine synthase|nr:6,7-dimethyl-8-ribityllumazine synthase [Planctomycetota bacterium]MSR37455.1 6,7-dimethyl-8-ribityllumazine synthase [Planctomycetota bacterium]